MCTNNLEVFKYSNVLSVFATEGFLNLMFLVCVTVSILLRLYTNSI